MSELSQDAARRIVDMLDAPLPQNAEAAAAWDRGERCEYRYVVPAGIAPNEWVDCGEHEGFDFRLGGHYIRKPNWQHPSLEYRRTPTAAPASTDATQP